MTKAYLILFAVFFVALGIAIVGARNETRRIRR